MTRLDFEVKVMWILLMRGGRGQEGLLKDDGEISSQGVLAVVKSQNGFENTIVMKQINKGSNRKTCFKVTHHSLKASQEKM